MSKIYWKLFAMTAIMFLSYGCVKEDEKIDDSSLPVISFSVVEGDVVDAAQTKATDEMVGFEITSESGKSIPVMCETSDMTIDLDDFSTKGTRYGSEEGFRSQTFGVYSWEGTTIGYNGESVKYDSEKKCWIPATKKYWPYKETMTFAAVYPKDGCTFTAIAKDNMDFSYTTKASTADQADLMLAYYSGSWDKANPGRGTLAFTHALTCINFKAGTLTDVTSIDEISLSGVYADGTCAVTESSSPTYVWTPGSTTTTVTSSGKVESASFSTLEDNAGYNFLIIPQDAQTKNVTLTVKLTTTAGSETFTKTLDNSIIKSAWTAGKKYTFKLGYNGGDVDLSVDDNVENNTKDDLSICNTGTADAYFRVALVGNWQNESGEIIENWDETQGTFTGLPGTNWFKEGDFYYYKNPVDKAGETPTEITDLLFTKYEAPATPPSTGVALHLSIVVQAVKYDKDKAKVTEAWGSTVADKLNTK